MSAPPLASVVVVNFNGRSYLESCLRSLLTQAPSVPEIIVVDNGSTDGSLELLAQKSFGSFTVVRNRTNRGFCTANNQGIAAASGRYVALLNNDAEATPRWLAELTSALESDSGLGMAASKILLHRDHATIDKVGHLIYPDGQNRGRGSGELDRGQYDRLEETAWPDGCAALYRRSMLDQIGGFDEDFFAYADDAELGLRARIAGWDAVYVPTAVAYHRVGSTLGRYSERRLFLIERNRAWLVAKLFPKRLWPLVPFFHGLRVAATAWSGLRGRGEAGRARQELSTPRLIQCLLKANWAALRGLPLMLRKRRQIAALRKLNGAETAALLRRFRIPLADLVSRAS